MASNRSDSTDATRSRPAARRPDLLEIVEHQQRGLTGARGPCTPRQVTSRHVGKPESLGDRRRYEGRVANHSQRDEHHAGGALVGDCTCEFERQARLSRASRTGECDQAGGRISQPLPQRLHIGLAAEKRRQRHRQRAAAQFIGRGARQRGPGRCQERVAGGAHSDRAPRRGRARSPRAGAAVPRAPGTHRVHGETRKSWRVPPARNPQHRGAPSAARQMTRERQASWCLDLNAGLGTCCTSLARVRVVPRRRSVLGDAGDCVRWHGQGLTAERFQAHAQSAY